MNVCMYSTVLPSVMPCFSDLICFYFPFFSLIKITKMSRINTAVSRKREQRVLFMVVTMVVCYLLCWLPYGVMALLATFGRPGLVTPAASIVPSLLAKTSTVINPIIYIFMNKQVGANRKTVLTANQSVCKDACLTFSERRVTVRPLFPEYVLVVWPIACTLLVKLLFSQYLHLHLHLQL